MVLRTAAAEAFLPVSLAFGFGQQVGSFRLTRMEPGGRLGERDGFGGFRSELGVVADAAFDPEEDVASPFDNVFEGMDDGLRVSMGRETPTAAVMIDFI